MLIMVASERFEKPRNQEGPIGNDEGERSARNERRKRGRKSKRKKKKAIFRVRKRRAGEIQFSGSSGGLLALDATIDIGTVSLVLEVDHKVDELWTGPGIINPAGAVELKEIIMLTVGHG